MEKFSISAQRWEKLKGTPQEGYNGNHYHQVNYCAYWDGFVYLTLYVHDVGNKFKGYYHHEKIHILNTYTGGWAVSSEKVQRKSLGSVVAIIQN